MPNHLCSPNSQETDNIEKLRALCLRWNKAAAQAGYAGSEYIDDPEFVFARVAESQRSMMRALVKAKKYPVV